MQFRLSWITTRITSATSKARKSLDLEALARVDDDRRERLPEHGEHPPQHVGVEPRRPPPWRPGAAACTGRTRAGAASASRGPGRSRRCCARPPRASCRGSRARHSSSEPSRRSKSASTVSRRLSFESVAARLTASDVQPTPPAAPVTAITCGPPRDPAPAPGSRRGQTRSTVSSSSAPETGSGRNSRAPARIARRMIVASWSDPAGTSATPGKPSAIVSTSVHRLLDVVVDHDDHHVGRQRSRPARDVPAGRRCRPRPARNPLRASIWRWRACRDRAPGSTRMTFTASFMDMDLDSSRLGRVSPPAAGAASRQFVATGADRRCRRVAVGCDVGAGHSFAGVRPRRGCRRMKHQLRTL